MIALPTFELIEEECRVSTKEKIKSPGETSRIDS